MSPSSAGWASTNNLRVRQFPGSGFANSPEAGNLLRSAPGNSTPIPEPLFAGSTIHRPGALKGPWVTTHNAAALADGFLVTEGYRLDSLGSDYAFILDKDGELVWWYQSATLNTSLSAAKMTYDGKAMWLAGDNVPQGTAMTIYCE